LINCWIRQASASFSEEKEAKRLLRRWALGITAAKAHDPTARKFFARFFSKKRRLLACAARARPALRVVVTKQTKFCA
jgi:hypothetical protein